LLNIMLRILRGRLISRAPGQHGQKQYETQSMT
jgi:hypothetical protein